MNKFFVIFAAVVLALPCQAQVGQPQPVLSKGTSNTWNLDWDGITNRTYFLQHSDDLLNWQYFPVIESGSGQTLGYGFASSADRFFLRLVYTDAPSEGNPDTADFDNDGVSNLAELQAGLDPFHFADSDSDGLPDDWETVHAGTFAVYPGALGAQFQSGSGTTRSLILSNDTSQSVAYSIALQNNELPIYSSQSSANGGPAFSWEDISTTGTLLTTVSGGDDVSQTVNLSQFSFPYYDSTYSAVHVSSNGCLTLGTPNTAYGNTKLPLPSSPSLLIAPLWDDLNPGAGGDVYVEEFSNRLVIQYQQVAPYSGTGTLTFEVVIYANGEIDFRYNTLTASVMSCTVGIQNVDGTQGLQFVFNEAYLSDQFAVRIRPVTSFFTLNQFTGTILSHSQTNLTGTFTGAGVNPGIYTAQVQVSHNGAGASPITIPAIATITELDTDGDLIPDAYEIANDLNPLVNDAALDHDEDGLTNLQEYQLGTLANQPDTDGDGLSDGWEVKYGYSPLVNNTTDGDPTNDPTADPDNDGLINSAEDQIGTNPNNEDTDGDGFSDFVEDQAGSNATGAGSTPGNPGGTPGGPATPPPPTIPVEVNFGDHSGSHSEKYRVYLEPLEGDANTQKRYRTNSNYGQTQTETFNLPAGAKYKITLKHIGTDPEYDGPPKPDYDYTLDFTSNSNDAAIAAIPEDNAGILGVHDESEDFFAEGKSATLYVAWLTSETVATHPSDRKRKKIGVGEEIDLALKPPSLPSPTWGALTGTPGTSVLTPSGATARLEAGRRACTPTVESTILGTTLHIDYNVVQPSGESATKTSDMSFASGVQGVGMELEVTTLPNDVSFYNVEVIEIDKGTQNVTGFFTPFPASALKHTPNPNWIQLDQQNRWTDSAGFFGWGSSTTWAYGTYEWAIEVRWRVVGKETGQGEVVGNRVQTHTLNDSTGNSTESKLNNTATRTP